MYRRLVSTAFLPSGLLQLQNFILLVERVDLQAVRSGLVLGAFVRDLPRAHVVEITLVRGGVLLVIRERGLGVALFLRELVQQAVRYDQRLGVLVLFFRLVADRTQREPRCADSASPLFPDRRLASSDSYSEIRRRYREARASS